MAAPASGWWRVCPGCGCERQLDRAAVGLAAAAAVLAGGVLRWRSLCACGPVPSCCVTPAAFVTGKDDPAAVNRAAMELLEWLEDAADTGDLAVRCEALARQCASGWLVEAWAGAGPSALHCVSAGHKSRLEVIAEDIGAGVGGHLVDFDRAAVVRVGRPGDLHDRGARRELQPVGLFGLGHSRSEVFAEPGWAVSKLCQAGVCAAWSGVGLCYERPGHQVGRQVGARQQHGFAVEHIPSAADGDCGISGEVQQGADVGRGTGLMNFDLVDGQVAPFGVGRPDWPACGPGVAGPALNARADDGAEASDVDACALAGHGQPFVDEQAECLAGGHARDLVSVHDLVLARERAAGPVVTSLDCPAQLIGDLPVLRLAAGRGAGHCFSPLLGVIAQRGSLEIDATRTREFAYRSNVQPFQTDMQISRDVVDISRDLLLR